MNTPLPVVPVHPPIAPRDEREAAIIAEHQRDLAEKWGYIVGPLIRRRCDGKLIRLPDRPYGHMFDAQAACDLYVLGRGPGRSHSVQCWWIDAALAWPTWDAVEQAEAAARALRNHQAFLNSLHTNPPAPRDAHKFASVHRPFPAWAKVHQAAPVAPVRAETPVKAPQMA